MKQVSSPSPLATLFALAFLDPALLLTGLLSGVGFWKSLLIAWVGGAVLFVALVLAWHRRGD